MIHFYQIIKTGLLILILTSASCYADVVDKSLVPTPALINGTAKYEEMISWAEHKIIADAHKTGSSRDIKQDLADFPVKVDAHCGNMSLLFIKKTPECGNINCSYLMFREMHSSEKQVSYRYIDELGFAAVRLFCYANKSQDYTYYLVTSWNESNSTSTLQLDEILNNNHVHKSSITVDYSRSTDAKFIDSLWEKTPEEKRLLLLFKKK